MKYLKSCGVLHAFVDLEEGSNAAGNKPAAGWKEIEGKLEKISMFLLVIAMCSAVTLFLFFVLVVVVASK